MCLSHLVNSICGCWGVGRKGNKKEKKISSRTCSTPRSDRSAWTTDRSVLSLTVSPFWADRSVCLADRSDPVQILSPVNFEIFIFLGSRWDLGYPPWTHLTICEASWADALHGWFECIEVQSISISNGMKRRDISSISKYKTFPGLSRILFLSRTE